ncbi:hypothetical protein ACN47E_002316 [Coniothyrium glycines]
MALIYAQARFTIVAVEGDASYGLAGVSRPRPVKRTLEFDENFCLVEQVEDFTSFVRRSKWASRGWTYQEELASSCLVYFSDNGICIRKRDQQHVKTYSERPSQTIFALDHLKSVSGLLTDFSNKSLSNAADRLRAISGILYALFGKETSYGIPWSIFDCHLLWYPSRSHHEEDNKFKTNQEILTISSMPTWSWASLTTRVQFELSSTYATSLAYWGRPNVDIEGTTWIQISAVYARDDDVEQGNTFENTALAWLSGCLERDLPSDLLEPISLEESVKRLVKRWDKSYNLYWHEAFDHYTSQEMFGTINVDKSLIPRSLAVRTQVMPSFRPEEVFPGTFLHGMILRTTYGKIAGFVKPDLPRVQMSDLSGTPELRFLALSVQRCDSQSWARLRLDFYGGKVSPDFFGCRCNYQDIQKEAIQHSSGCSHYAETRGDAGAATADCYPCGNVDPEVNKELFTQALSTHYAEVSYLDSQGNLLHEHEKPPMLNIMMIAPIPVQSGNTMVYKRLGIGEVYLKRWVEASPKFETIVLV